MAGERTCEANRAGKLVLPSGEAVLNYIRCGRMLVPDNESPCALCGCANDSLCHPQGAVYLDALAYRADGSLCHQHAYAPSRKMCAAGHHAA